LGDDDPRDSYGPRRLWTLRRLRRGSLDGRVAAHRDAVEQIWIFPAAPLWAFLIILLSVIVIYNLCAQGTEPV